MTQISLPWQGTTTGDATIAPYTAEHWSDTWRKLFTRDRTKQGVIQYYEGELNCTSGTNSVTIDTGAGLVDGVFYENDASVTIDITTPISGTRKDYVVLRKTWATQTVRLALLTGTEGGTEPTLTQVDGVVWEIPLWLVTITTAGDISLTDRRNWLTTPLTGLIDAGYGISEMRLTLDSGYAIPESNVTNATSVFLTPYYGNKIKLWDDGLEKWYYVSCDSDVELPITNSQICNSWSSGYTITGIDTSQLIVDMVVTGTNVQAGTVITSIDSPTQVTVNKTPSGTVTAIDFKLPKDTLFDIFAYKKSDDTVGLEFCKWSNSGAGTSTRATNIYRYDGVWCKYGDKTRLYLGTVMTTSTDGESEDSVTKRFLWNAYNRAQRLLYISDTNSHTYASDTHRPWNNNPNVRFSYIAGLKQAVYFSIRAQITGSSTHIAEVFSGGYDNITAGYTYGAKVGTQINSPCVIGTSFPYVIDPGYHYSCVIERMSGASTGTFTDVYSWGYIET
ncbi:MAG: hypothetical protein HPY87_08885 [Fervidobacterium sp.]|uniref:hypothetical protein n=1 Tax=Fervidobacterium sp. TaxID=1871331 RepID=UPI0025C33E81|nr:hypothetical protein [Fervidobacterium sp.]NPU89975.1 hypothetical protein [Fervidobacterium sp.]